MLSDPPGYRIEYGGDGLLHVFRIWDSDAEVGDGFSSREEAIAATQTDAPPESGSQ